jgi:hypothetical protein
LALLFACKIDGTIQAAAAVAIAAARTRRTEVTMLVPSEVKGRRTNNHQRFAWFHA